MMNYVCKPNFRAACIFLLSLIGLMGVQLPKGYCSAQTPFVKGETLNYTVEKFKVKVGEASLVYGGVVTVKGRPAHFIRVTATGFEFYDEDKIYLDTSTFRPIMVERDLDIFGVKEKITEYYSPDSGKVRIVKMADGKQSEQVIEGNKPFDHIYGFIYGRRLEGELRKGEEYHLYLPTREVRFAKAEKKEIRLKGEKYNTLYMESEPKKYEVYFDRDNGMIPLRIKGAIGVGNMSMVFVDPDK